MDEIESDFYDFVLSSHMLEHTANPILTLNEWKRVLKDGGTLVMLLPDKKQTFDHLRPVTTMEHLIEDFNARMQEDDLTHLPEILALHDLARDPNVANMETFKLRSVKNFENRCLHHHVFDKLLAIDLVEYSGLTVLAVEELAPHHILIMARR